MASLKFAKGGESHLFYFRNKKIDTHALKLNSQYIDLTTNSNLSSFTKIKFNINGVTHYLRDRYFNSQDQWSGNYTNRAYKPSRPVTHTINVPVGNYQKYRIALRGNFDVMGWFDFNNTSYTEGSHFKGNFSSPVNPIKSTGNKHPGYTVTWVSDPNGLNMSYPPQTMNGEITLTGNVWELNSSDKQLFYRQMTNSVGDGVYVSFRVYARVNAGNLIVTYGWWLNGYDERCSGNLSYSINIGVCTHE